MKKYLLKTFLLIALLFLATGCLFFLIGYQELKSLENEYTKEELFKLINNEAAIRVLVLGVSTETGNPGPLINYIINNGSNECRVPITIVPGNLSDDQIDALV